MHGGHVAERGRQRAGVALDDDVELARRAAEQQVAHGAADEVHAVAPAAASSSRRPHASSPRRSSRSSIATVSARPGASRERRTAAASITTMTGVIPPPRRVQALARLALGVVVFVFVAAPLVFGREGDVTNSDVGFVETTETTPATAAARARVERHPADDRFEWPVYGFTKTRTHHLPLDVTPRPPYRQAWAIAARSCSSSRPCCAGARST